MRDIQLMVSSVVTTRAHELDCGFSELHEHLEDSISVCSGRR